MALQFKLPLSGWDYFPLPTLDSPSNPTEQYELVIKITVPPFIKKLFGFASDEPNVSTPTDTSPEDPLVIESRRHIESGSFMLCKEGVGGTYFVKNQDDTLLSVFKPSDEEPGAINNPKNIIQNPILPPGGGSLREIAAYLLDKDHRAGVPETFMLNNVRHKGFSTDEVKSGSLQRFVKNDGVSSDMGSSLFSTDEVHRIGILDVRLFNMDRNGENLLVKKNSDGYHLIPIDHTYCLPPINRLDGAFFEWHYWPQAKQPFSQDLKSYVASLDIERDTVMLRSLGLDEPSILTMATTTIFLKEAVLAGWNLFQIAALMSRGIPITKESRFEELISTCLKVTSEGAKVHRANFLDVFGRSVKTLLASSPPQT